MKANLSTEPAARPWDAALESWRSASPAARRLTYALPLIAASLFYVPSLFGPKSSTPGASTNFNSFLAAVRSRATVDLREDFRSGIDSWNGAEGWQKSWSLDGAGSARPGRLALLRDSLPLVDYRLEFLGQIESKGLSFAFRAADSGNYQAGRLVVVKPGPLPSLAFVHYPVIEGVEGRHTQSPLLLEARGDTIYKLVVTVEGDHFTVTVNGVYAASWTDSRLRTGGVGFFADKGEAARLRSVHVVEHEDVLGQICYQVSQWTADRRAIGVKDE